MEHMLMEYFVNSLWQAPLLAAGAWLVLRAGRPGPRVQHGVWVAALALMVAMPLLSLHSAESAAAPSAAPMPVAADAQGLQQVEADAPHLPLTWSRAAEQDVQAVQIMPSEPQEPAHWLRMREVRLGAVATRWLVGLYLAAIGFAMMRLLWSWVVARRMVAEATPAALTVGDSALLDACCERLQVRRPQVLVSARTASPLVVGVLRPVLLLPARFAEQMEESAEPAGRELEAVWWHELAHVRRRDYLANLVCRVWALPVAYHPATYAVERRVRQTREMVCDRMAAAEMRSPVGYARCLVGLAQRMQAECGIAGQLQGTGMFDGGVLEERVIELIETKAAVSVGMRAVRLAGGVAMVAAVMCVAAMFHLTPTMAQVATNDVTAGVALPQVALVAEPTLAVASMSEARMQAQTAQPTPSIETAPPGDARAKAAEAKSDIDGTEFKQQMEDLNKIEKQIAEFRKAMTDSAARFNTPEFRQQMEGLKSPELRKQMEDSAAKFNSPEFKRQMERLNSPQIEEQIAEFRKEMEDAAAKLNGPEFKQQMERFNDPEIRKEIEDAAVNLNGPRFTREMVEQQLERMNSPEARKDMERLNSPEFKKELDDAMKAASKLKSPEYKQQMLNLNGTELSQQIAELSKQAGAGAPAQTDDGHAPAATDKPLRVSSGTIAGSLISRPDPVYPPAAKAMRIQGTVVLHVVISKTGTVKYLAVGSGPKMLQLSAFNAVEQWKYRPYLLDGEPVEVEGTVNVNFSLDVPQPAAGGPVRVSSGEMMANIVARPEPVYPPEAKAAHVQGAVVLDVGVSKTGTVDELAVVSGPEKLQLSAIDAVKQWTFKPYLVNGAPAPVETMVTVNFLPYDPAKLQDRSAGQGVAGDGEISGVVIDQNGAVIAGASVKATNTETGLQIAREVTHSGTYSIAPLPAGNYNVEAVARGFRRVLQENVQVSAGQKVGLNLRLAVGEVNENLNVTGSVVDSPDRDHAKAVQAEAEYRLMLQQFPDSPLAPEAAQRLREVQESLAGR